MGLSQEKDALIMWVESIENHDLSPGTLGIWATNELYITSSEHGDEPI